MSLSSIVSVNISSTSVQVSRAGFGIPMVLGFHTHFPERIRFYTGVAGMITDGFSTSDFEYKAAAALFAQNPAPQQIAVGRRLTAPTQTVRFTPTVTTVGEVYTLTIGSEEFTYTVQTSDTVALIIDGLVADMAGHTGAWTPTDNVTYLSIAADVAGASFDMVFDRGFLTANDDTTDAGIATDLGEIYALNDTWYGLISTSHGAAEIAAAAAWCLTNKRLYVASSLDSDILAAPATDIAGVLAAASNGYVAVIYDSNVHGFPEAAWMGRLFPTDPGSSTWAYHTLAGITYADYTPTEITNMKAKFCNFYTTVAGLASTQTGQVASGEWVDAVRGDDWLAATIAEDVFTAIAAASATSSKIPYTQGGVNAIGSVVHAALNLGVRRGLLSPLDGTASPAEGVHVPLLADIPVADRTNRNLPDVKFYATRQGAIHTVAIAGVVSV